MKNAIRPIICKLTGKQFVDAKYLREHGAIIGDDVELLNFQCSAKDATCLQIGSHCTLSCVSVLTHDASLKRFIGDDCNRIGRVVIGENVFIGKNTLILPGVTIGDNCVIGGGSVVTKDIPSGSVAAGNPARVISSLDDFLEKHRKRMMEDSSLVYYNISRDKMNQEELREFNNQISGKIVYLLRKETD